MRKGVEMGMIDREKVIKGIECCLMPGTDGCEECPYIDKVSLSCGGTDCLLKDALALLKAQELLKQKMWNALYAEEDKLEERYVGTDEHDRWFLVYRDWLQRGFGIAINVIAEQEGR